MKLAENRSARSHAHGRRQLGSGWSQETVGSTDPDQIRSWWRRDPAANIGVVNGHRSGVLILDVDRKPGRPDGLESLWAVQAEIGEQLPVTATVETPSGGRHLWLRLPPDERVPIPKVWLPSVELTWQVAVPPSCRAVPMRDSSLRDSEVSFLSYRWSTDVEALPVAPPWLLADIRSRRGLPYGGSAVAGSQSSWRSEEKMPPTEWFIDHGLGGWSGSRNIDCHRLACRLWRHHWPYDDLVTQVIYQAWSATDATDFPWTEALVCIRSAREHVVPQVEAERAWINQLRSDQ